MQRFRPFHAAVALLLGGPAALAQGWKFTGAAYGWLAGIDGTVATFGGVSAGVKLTHLVG